MKIKIFLINLYVLSLFLFFYPKNSSWVFSEENLNKTINYICLKKVHCLNKEGEGRLCTKHHVHRVQLSTDPQKKFPSNKEIYIAECIYYTENNQVVATCTTGSNELDKEIFNSNNLDILNRKTGYSLSKDDNYGIFKIERNQATKISPQSFKTNPEGETPILEWQSFTPRSFERKWYGFFIVQNQEEAKVGQGGLQQGKVQFPPFQDKDCAGISWDPAGRVFDAKTLEPIPNVQVTLLKKYGNEFSDARKTELTIVNPYITLEDGGFSFFVNNGEYKLISYQPNYEFPVSSLNEIHENYQKIYINLRYGKFNEPKTLIYPTETGEVITVKNRMEFRDIPLNPKNKSGYNYPLKIYSFHQQLNKSNQKIVFSGKVSHPFTKVTLYKTFINEKGEEISQVYDSYLSDYLGKFNFSIPLENLSQNETISDAKFEKSDLNNLDFNSKTSTKKFILFTKLFKKVFAQNENNIINLKLNPILPQIEGYAYDDKGQILPNTKVIIYLKLSNTPYYITNTDNKGYFKIPTNKLPNETYEIRYQKQNEEFVKLSTFKFLTQNSSYLIKNKIDLNKINNNKEIKNELSTNIDKNDAKKKIENNYSKLNNKNEKTKNLTNYSISNNNNSFILLTFLTILILFILVSTALFFYYKKNRLQS